MDKAERKEIGDLIDAVCKSFGFPHEHKGVGLRDLGHAFYECDRSIPKRIGKQLLELHLRRGDDIYIISRRQGTVPPTNTVTHRLERMFGIHLQHPVVQTKLKDKTPFIATRHIVYYYGDSDSDITAAVGARAVPIRVQRSTASYAKDQPHNGQLNEIVLENSRN